MGAIKRKKKSLKWDFVKYFLVCIILILTGSLLLGISAEKFFPLEIYEYRFLLDGNGDISLVKTPEPIITQHYILLLDATDLFQCIVIPLWSLACVAVCGTLFYRRKIEKPIRILSNASENISNNRLDFSVEIPESNELGELCSSFEKMRLALRDNNLEMWRRIEERKRLNAAFSHDLRTPLTVLKGQSEMLIRYAPQMSEDKIIETAETMKRHITRLETYVNTMSELQRLEDVEIKKESVTVREIENQLRLTGTSLSGEKDFSLFTNTPVTDTVNIDIETVMRVYENLLSNAFRYAKSKVETAIDKKDGVFILTVTDDGEGFTPDCLKNATKPFYKKGSDPESEHFGMGLNISKILCEKHGGSLQLSNVNGAVAVATFEI